jgi:hypothetical protein
LSDGAILADAVLDIKKPGAYRFSAPRYIYPDGMTSGEDEELVELGKITWGSAGPPSDSSGGSFPFQIRWQKNVPKTQDDPDRSHETDNLIYFELRDSSDAEGNFLYSVYSSPDLTDN